MVEYFARIRARRALRHVLAPLRLSPMMRAFAPEDLSIDFEQELLERLLPMTNLERSELRKVLLEVIALTEESAEEWVRRRHGELRAMGLRNAEIFPLLRDGLAGRRVAPRALSLRQVRRVIYG